VNVPMVPHAFTFFSRGLTSVVMPAFLYFLDDLRDKGLEVSRISACDQSVIHHNWLIAPVRASVDHVRFDRLVRRCVRAFHNAGLNQQPWPMADSGERLARFIELPDQLNRFLIYPQEIRIDLSAGNDQGVILLWVDILEIFVDWDLLAPVLHIPTADHVGALTVLGR